MKTGRKLFLKLFILIALCGGVFFVLGNQSTSAATCEQRRQWCVEACDWIFNPSDPSTWSCYEDCEWAYQACVG